MEVLTRMIRLLKNQNMPNKVSNSWLPICSDFADA